MGRIILQHNHYAVADNGKLKRKDSNAYFYAGI